MVEIFIISFLAASTPGPDFLIVLKNSLNYGFKLGVATSFGIVSSIACHLIYTNMGLILLFKQKPIFFKIISFLGFLYLTYMGISSFLNKKAILESEVKENSLKDKTFFKGFKNGFLTNALNPNVPFFFMFLFTEIIGEKSHFLMFFFSVEIVLTVFLCFCSLSFLVSINNFRKVYFKFISYFNKAFGIIIIFFAFKILCNVF